MMKVKIKGKENQYLIFIHNFMKGKIMVREGILLGKGMI